MLAQFASSGSIWSSNAVNPDCALELGAPNFCVNWSKKTWRSKRNTNPSLLLLEVKNGGTRTACLLPLPPVIGPHDSEQTLIIPNAILAPSSQAVYHKPPTLI